MSDEVEETIIELLEDGKRDELQALLSIANEVDTIIWDDVSKHLTPKTWGECIESEILTHIEGRQFELKKIDTLSDFVKEGEKTHLDPDLPEVDADEASWSKYDKGMAVICVVSMLGFAVDPIRMAVYSLLNPFYGQIIAVMPLYATVLVLALITSLWSEIARERINSNSINEYREHINELRDDDSTFGLPEDATQAEEEKIMELQSSMMKAQTRPFVWILVLTIPTLVWINTAATITMSHPPVILPIFGEQPWAYSLIGPFNTWLFWYIICRITVSQIVKKQIQLIDW